MSIPLRDQVAIVTGASSGIGEGISETLAAEGAKVVLAARREERLEGVAEGIRRNGGTALPIRTDMTKDADVDGLVEKSLAAYGRIDLLVNCAGVSMHQTLVKTTMDDFQRLFAVNVFGLVRCTKAVVPHMIEQQTGTIVNISSGSGFMGSAESSAYCATKHAVNGFGKAIYDELRHEGIQVYTVGPGAVNTTMMSHQSDDPARKEMLQVEDIADLVLFLATRDRRMSIEPLWTYSRFRG